MGTLAAVVGGTTSTFYDILTTPGRYQPGPALSLPTFPKPALTRPRGSQGWEPEGVDLSADVPAKILG